MKSSTEDFVQELIDFVNDMGGKIPYAAIVVGFENSSLFANVLYHGPVTDVGPINTHIPARARMVGELNEALRSGAKPIGLVGFTLKLHDETWLSVGHPYSNPFPKYRKKRWAHDLLRRRAESFQRRMMEWREATMSALDAQERAASLN